MEEYKIDILVCGDDDVHFCIYKLVGGKEVPILLTDLKDYICNFIQNL